MRVLLSAVGTRGDVQPIFALAVAVRELGHAVRLCIPPNFVHWAAELGFEASAVGVEMRAPDPKAAAPQLSEEQLRKLRESMPDLISDQFDKLSAAAVGCDAILGANAHQYAARSIAELHHIPYFNALYAPIALPSPEHAPPPAPGQPWEIGTPDDNRKRWQEHLVAWNNRALERVNANRTRLGLAPIDSVLEHVISARPWLAADATLAPLPAIPALEVFQTGAWILEDRAPLPSALEAFLDAGEAPLYFGFGSMPTRDGTSHALIAAARSLGRRAILSQGWGRLELIDDARDCIAIGDVNQQALFTRVAAVIHHGGAGTTTTAARAGAPQLITPMFSDQFYWAQRVRSLGVGTSVPHAQLSSEALVSRLRDVLTPEVAARAGVIASQVTCDGAASAARRLLAALGEPLSGQHPTTKNF